MAKRVLKRIRLVSLTALLVVGMAFSCTFTNARYYYERETLVDVPVADWVCELTSDFNSAATFAIEDLVPGESKAITISIDSVGSEFPSTITMSFSTFGTLPVDLKLYVDADANGLFDGSMDTLRASVEFDTEIIPKTSPVTLDFSGDVLLGSVTVFYLVIDWPGDAAHRNEIFSGELDYLNAQITVEQKLPS